MRESSYRYLERSAEMQVAEVGQCGRTCLVYYVRAVSPMLNGTIKVTGSPSDTSHSVVEDFDESINQTRSSVFCTSCRYRGTG